MPSITPAEMPVAAPQVSVLIVAYNSMPYIARCLSSVFAAAQGIAVEVLLIDNGDDGTASHVGASFPHVVVVPSRGNIGFGAGNNELARHARAPVLLLLNPDMVLSPDAITHLLALSGEKSDAAAWGGVTLDHTGKADASNHLRFPRLQTLARRLLFLGDRAANPNHSIGSQVSEIEVIMGGFAMIPRTVWQEIGGFDESFFLYCEESDWFVRAHHAGRKAWRTPLATSTHFAGSGNSLSPSRMLYQASGLSHFMHKHWSWPKAWAGVLLWWLVACERYGLGCIAGRFWPAAGQIGEAYRLVALHPQRWMKGYGSSYWLAQLGPREPR